MTRPISHRELNIKECCGTCKHSAVPEYKDDLLCFCGDSIDRAEPCVHEGTIDVRINGNSVGLMDGDSYDHVWGGRVVNSTDVCDEWEQEPFQ